MPAAPETLRGNAASRNEGVTEAADELKPVRSLSPFPDICPRSVEDIRLLRQMKNAPRAGGSAGKILPRCNLPYPYVNDDECDEFEDNTIDMTRLNVSEKSRATTLSDGSPKFLLCGPSVTGGTVTPVLEGGMLYRIISSDGSWYYYNDTHKYEMHIKLTFTCRSEVEPGENVELYRENDKEIMASLVVLPEETCKLFSGKIRSYRCQARAIPLNDCHREEIYGEINDRIADEIAALVQKLGKEEKDITEEDVMIYCEKHKSPYIDIDFRPCDYSLYRPDLDAYRLRFVPWNRPASWVPVEEQKELRLFRREISPTQVTEGSIGNTYLSSAFAALSERPAKIRDLFRHPVAASTGKLERSIGAYWVTMNVNGWWLPILLDDFFPATVEGPEFTRCGIDIRRLWVPLLEKCYAKTHGSYSNIAAGDPLEPLTECTGFPVTRFESYWHDEKDSLFEAMRDYQKAGYLQILCTPVDSGDRFSNAYVSQAEPQLEAKYEEMGLRLHHGYAVLQVVSFDSGLQLVQIRNPWGTGKEWKGAWSKEDSRWSEYPEVQSTCYPAESGKQPMDEDHTFWMDWEDAWRIFSGGGCCHLRDNWFDYRVRGEFQNCIPSVCLEINVGAPTEIYFMLSQQDERDDPECNYSAILLELFQWSGKSKYSLLATSTSLVEYPGESLHFSYSREVALKVTLEPADGPFLLVPRMLEEGEHLSRPFILGVLPETYIGNGLKVEFKKLPEESKVFQNLSKFNPGKNENILEEVTAVYQVRTARQPLEVKGSEIIDERLKEFGLQGL